MARPQSISLHLFLWLFGSGLLALLAGGGVLYLEVRNLTYSSLDHTLQSELEIFTGLLHVEHGRLEFEYAETIHGDYIVPRSGHYFQVYVDGAVMAASLSLAGEGLTTAADQLVVTDPELQLQIYRGRGPAGEPLRLMERALVFAGHPARVIVAQTVAESEQLLRRFRTFLLLSGGAGILLIALLGQAISRRSLRPLREFSARFDRIGEKSLEQRLPTANQFIEMDRLSGAFNAMLDRLQRTLQAREELLSEVSHELKTPVTVIRSHCDIYLQQPRPAADYVEALEAIRASADLLGRKIHRLLGIAQTEADLMAANFAAVDLGACLRQARVTVAPLARDAGIGIVEDLAPGLQVHGHAERLVEAFANLLENAVKYNCLKGKVMIRATASAGQARVDIEDSGCGIAPQDLDKIFERFYRGQGRDRAEGSGLGLVLVKTIIEAHQGQIEAGNRPEGGSRFSVTLPLG
jgi:signal transduction histidine kinase